MKRFVSVLSGILFTTYSLSVFAETTSKEAPMPVVKVQKKASAEVIDSKEAISKTFENVIEFQKLALALTLDDKQLKDALKKLTEQQRALSVSLNNSGIFKIFRPLDWMQNESQEGKIFVALIYLQKYPQYATPKTVERMKQIAQNPSQTLKPILDATLNIYDDYAKKHPYN